MVDRKTIARRKLTFVSFAIFFCAMVLAYETGKRLPYVYTEGASNIRAFVISPLIFLFLLWATLVHKWAESGRTGAQMALGQLKSRADKAKHVAAALLGAALISAFLPVSLNYFVVWAAHWVANDRFAMPYKAWDVKGISSVFEVTMDSLPSRDEVKIRQTREQLIQAKWKVGDRVCVRGRTSLFGALVDSIERESDGVCR